MHVRAFGSWMSAPRCLFFQDFEGLTEVFAPGRPPGYPRGRPRDVWPQNLLFGLPFRSWALPSSGNLLPLVGFWARILSLLGISIFNMLNISPVLSTFLYEQAC